MKQPTIQEIGPDEAKMFLEGNIGNRKIDKRVVARYAREMREGRWIMNGSTITIFDDGKSIRLMNGQHRLLAVIESGVTITVIVAEVETDAPEVFSTIDVGKNRPTAQILQMAGTLNATAVLGIARADILLREEREYAWDRSTTRTITASEILEWEKDQDMELVHRTCLLYQEARRRTQPTNVWYAALTYQILKASPNRDRYLPFHHFYSTGLDLRDGSPIYALRQYTINRAGPRAGVQSTWDRQAHLAVGIKAWNDWLSEREVSFYRFTRKSLPMPEVK